MANGGNFSILPKIFKNDVACSPGMKRRSPGKKVEDELGRAEAKLKYIPLINRWGYTRSFGDIPKTYPKF